MWLGARSTKKILGLVTVCVVALSACSESADSPSRATEPQAVTSDAKSADSTATGEEETEATAQVDTGESGFLEMIDSESDLRTASSGGVIGVETADSGLVLTFEMGSQQCYGVRTSVVETDDEVIVDLQTGLRSDQTETCVEGVYPYQVSIELDNPLGDRPIRMAEPTEPVEDTIPVEQDTGSKPSVKHLVGIRIEEGVQWAIENDIEWYLESYDGVAREVPAAGDGNRLVFVAESDRIVTVEWK